MKTRHAIAMAAACIACGAPPESSSAHAPAPAPASSVPIDDVPVARRIHGCAESPDSAACLAIDAFASGHAPRPPSHARAYVGVVHCPAGSMPAGAGMYEVLIATSHDGQLGLHDDAHLAPNEVLSALEQALLTPAAPSSDPEVAVILTAARNPTVTVDSLVDAHADPTLDAAVVPMLGGGYDMIREADGVLYQLEHVDGGQPCVSVYRSVADVAVTVAPVLPSVTLEVGEISDTPPSGTADADVIAFVGSRLAEVQAVAARAVTACGSDQVGVSPARGTAVAGWSETVGVAASCWTGASGTDFLPQGDPERPLGTWAHYGRDGTLDSACSFAARDCADFSVYEADPRYVSIHVAAPVPDADRWVVVEVLLHR